MAGKDLMTKELEAAEGATPAEPAGSGWGCLPAPGVRPMPVFPGLLRALGPGVVWMALAQGSGELVWWPYIIAKYGLGFLFLLIPACLLQLPVNYEIGRYTLLTGESIWQGFVRLNRLLTLGMWVLMTISFLWLGGFVTAGGMDELTGFPAGWGEEGRRLFWAYTFIAVFFMALLLSRVVYRMIERVMTVVAVVTVVGLMAACSQTAVLARLGEFAGGLLGPRWPEGRSWDPDDATKLLTAITFAGLGGFWTLFYSYWLREKGAGMAAHMGRITSPITGRRVVIPRAGFVPEQTGEGATRWKQWRRYLAADNAVGVIGNLFTTLLCCLLAYALLFPKGRLPTDADPVGAQAEFFGSAWGPTGAALFLLLATAFLSDTWMTTIDAVSRAHTDVVYAYVPAARRLSQRRWYWIFVLLAGGITVVTLPYAQPGTMILLASVVGFAGTVTFTICLLILNHRVLPRMLPAAYRPRRWAWIGIAISVTAYACLAAAYGYVSWSR
ncbi:MAG: hypothetical protein AMXMBFR13_15020 [Phycisphaerae bacterium]